MAAAQPVRDFRSALGGGGRIIAEIKRKSPSKKAFRQQVAPEILRHRILLTFEAEAEGITTDDFIQRLLEMVAIP